MNEKKEVAAVEYSMMVPKEGKEVIDLLDATLEKIMSKDELSTFVELMDELYLAMDNISLLGYEAKSEFRDELAGYLVHKLMGRLWK